MNTKSLNDLYNIYISMYLHNYQHIRENLFKLNIKIGLRNVFVKNWVTRTM